MSLETNGSSSSNFPLLATLVANPAADVAVSSEEKVYDVILRQAALVRKQQLKSSAPIDVKPELAVPGTMVLLKEAYDRCGKVCAEYAKTFYLGQLSNLIFGLFLYRLGIVFGEVYGKFTCLALCFCQDHC